NSVTLGSVVPPFSSAFGTSNGLDGFTIIDANSDDITWALKSGAANLNYSRYLDSDDWLISPPLKLEKGKTYCVAYTLFTTSNSYKERVEVKWGSAPTAEGMTGELLAPYVFASIKDVDFDGYITPEADGIYYVGIHGISDKYQYGLNVAKLSIAEGLSVNAPDTVSDIEVVPDYNGLNKATIKFTAPKLDISGSALSSLTKIEVSRNGQLVKTFDTPAAGKALEFVDEPSAADTYTYTFVASNESGAGKAASIVSYVGINKPGTVTNLVARETSKNGEVTFTWDAPTVDADGYPLNPELLTYAVCEYTIDYKQILVKDGITETTFTYQAVNDDEEQQNMEWVVFAMTSKGSGAGTSTGVVAVGPDYTMPYKESVADGKLSYNFTSDQFLGGVWRPYTLETMPAVPNHDDDNGMFGMKGNGQDTSGSLTTGKIKIAGDKPGITFFVFNFHEEGQPADLNELNLYVSTPAGNDEKLLKHIDMSTFEATGWYPVVVALDEYKDKAVFFRFEGICRNYQYSFLDNIRVVELLDDNLSVLSIEAPEKVNAGDNFDVNVKVDNGGLKSADDFIVALYRNGDKVAELPGEAIEPGKNLTFTFAQTLRTVDGEDHAYMAKVEYAADADKSDNDSETLAVANIMPEYPAVTELNAETGAEGIALTWTAPELNADAPEAVTDDFEDGEPFSRAYGKWTFLDLDGKGVGGMTVPTPGITKNKPATFFVFDTEGDDYNSTFDAHSGTKYLASLFNYYYEAVDDWAISPRLFGGEQTISFFARSYHNLYTESIEILYSTTGTQADHDTSIAKYE
ncbi:MAG: choice-of-anchor J domain-containing protein, partial [Muribaculaceae bacterium]|nr:choice-of-anchor J domain-containing protein [Muribaculaceae bacterium]